MKESSQMNSILFSAGFAQYSITLPSCGQTLHLYLHVWVWLWEHIYWLRFPCELLVTVNAVWVSTCNNRHGHGFVCTWLWGAGCVVAALLWSGCSCFNGRWGSSWGFLGVPSDFRLQLRHAPFSINVFKFLNLHTPAQEGPLSLTFLETPLFG